MRKDGGSAFPNDWRDFQPGTGEQVVREHEGGMSLRDYFAIHAGYMGDCESHEQDAKARYAFADAMLAERVK